MAVVAYYAVLCDATPTCQRESDSEPTAMLARRAATQNGWHFHRLGGEVWYCPEHEAEWRAATPSGRPEG